MSNVPQNDGNHAAAQDPAASADHCGRILARSPASDNLLPVLRYECDHCGACCKGPLLVECDDIDVQREPRLIDVDRRHCGKSVAQLVYEIQSEWKAVLLPAPCPFLDGDNRCSIYPTRPNCCFGLQAGDDQCQMARSEHRLPPLAPVNEIKPKQDDPERS